MNYSIIRSSPLYGRGNGCNLSWFDQVRIALSQNKAVACDATELHSFAPINGVVDMVSDLVTGGPKTGIFHYAGLNRMTRYDLGRFIAKRLGLKDTLIEPKGNGPSFDYSLNTTETIRLLKIEPLLLEQGFDLLEKHLIARA